MTRMTAEEVRENVADGVTLAGLLGKYNSPSGEIEVVAEKERAGWDVIELSILFGGKRMVVSADQIEHNIARGSMTKAE